MADLQTRILVRSQPYRTQETSNGTIAAAAVVEARFDVSLVVCDRNQLNGYPSLTASLASVGPWLDVMVYSTGIGTLDIRFGVDLNMGVRSVLAAPLAVAAATPLLVSGMRIGARFVDVIFTNTSGGNVDYEFGAYVGSA